MALGMPTAGAMDRVGLRLANALAGNPAETAGLEIGVMGPRFAGRGRSVRVRWWVHCHLVDRSARCIPQGTGERPHASSAARPDAARRHGRGRQHRLSPSWPAVSLCHASWAASRLIRGRRRLASKGRNLAAGDTLPLAREAAPGAEERKDRHTIRLWQGAYSRRLGTAGRLFHRRRQAEPSPKRSIASPRKPTAWASASRGRPSPTPKVRTSSPTASPPARSRCPARACPSCCLADRQTVGGYPKIATVASVDLPRLGRLLPGHSVRFTVITIDEAERLRRDQETRIQRIIAGFQTAPSAGRNRSRPALRRKSDRRSRVRAGGR